jgi:hypothetical protein
VVADLEVGHAVADLLDDAGALVSEHARQREGMSPSRTLRSVWHSPVATIRTRTSPRFGPSTSTSSRTNGAWLADSTAAVAVGMGFSSV